MDPCCPLLRARIAHGSRTPAGSTRGQQLGHGSLKMTCVPMRRHTMCASPPPDWLAVLEGGSSIVSPGHLENAACSLDALDSEAFAETPPSSKVFHKLRDGNQKGRLLVR